MRKGACAMCTISYSARMNSKENSIRRVSYNIKARAIIREEKIERNEGEDKNQKMLHGQSICVYVGCDRILSDSFHTPTKINASCKRIIDRSVRIACLLGLRFWAHEIAILVDDVIAGEITDLNVRVSDGARKPLWASKRQMQTLWIEFTYCVCHWSTKEEYMICSLGSFPSHLPTQMHQNDRWFNG